MTPSDPLDLDQIDPKGLIRESYRIEGITPEQCRSVFVDWALSLPVGVDLIPALQHLIATYGSIDPGHPMTFVLHQGISETPTPRRRGGRAGRFGDAGPGQG